ncbi:MAG TPA: coenzyme F420-0:L-glutamate ligase [Actinomycetota bacterium]|nr:coenzyme F420-0:L-glutamate ligase [Actinomycetota bacterium]
MKQPNYSAPRGPVTILPVLGIGEIKEGDDVAASIAAALTKLGIQLTDDDVVVVTQKIISKAEGRVVAVPVGDDDARHRIAEQEAKQVLRRRDGLIITETHHGFVCANAGVDASNIDEGYVVLLPKDPDLSARRICKRLANITGASPAVIISDTFGRAWRNGQTNVAIGVAGMLPLLDYMGTHDHFGRELKVTSIAVADELAGAAELVMGKADGVPVAVIRGAYITKGSGDAKALIRQPATDMFR